MQQITAANHSVAKLALTLDSIYGMGADIIKGALQEATKQFNEGMKMLAGKQPRR